MRSRKPPVKFNKVNPQSKAKFKIRLCLLAYFAVYSSSFAPIFDFLLRRFT